MNREMAFELGGNTVNTAYWFRLLLQAPSESLERHMYQSTDKWFDVSLYRHESQSSDSTEQIQTIIVEFGGSITASHTSRAVSGLLPRILLSLYSVFGWRSSTSPRWDLVEGSALYQRFRAVATTESWFWLNVKKTSAHDLLPNPIPTLNSQ